MRTLTMVAIGALLWTSTSVHSAFGIDRIVAFGDSVSETGNTLNLIPFLTGSPIELPPEPYFDGRFSNGPIWLEQLSRRLGVAPVTSSSLGGTNYAFGGARIEDIDDEISLFDLGQQIDSALVGANPLALGAGLTLTDDDLIVLWGAGNDVLGVRPPGVPPTDGATLAGIMADHVRRLAEAGGSTFLIGNLSDLTQLPTLAGAPSPVLDFVQFQVLSYNAALEVALAQVAFETGVRIEILDVFGFSQAISNDPAAFGFTDIENPALTFFNADGDPIPNPVPPADLAALADIASFTIDDVATSAFWDTIHPTARYHELLGDVAFVTIVPEPGSMILLGLGFGGLILYRIRRHYKG